MTTIASRTQPLADSAMLAYPSEVYRPQEDTRLLIQALLASITLPGARALDLCTGSGAVAIAAAVGGADVTAVDACPLAVTTAQRSAIDAGVHLDAVCADVTDFDQTGFELITCNPPYVPTPPGTAASADGPAHAWNAGPDGRAVLDVVCASLPRLLAENGVALIVQSELADVDATVRALRLSGLSAKVIRERAIPLGPVIRSRRRALVDAGLLDGTQDRESIVVIRADRGARNHGRRTR